MVRDGAPSLSHRMRLPGLTSRCTMPMECSPVSASSTCSCGRQAVRRPQRGAGRKVGAGRDGATTKNGGGGTVEQRRKQRA